MTDFDRSFDSYQRELNLPVGAFGKMIELLDPDGIQLELHTLEQ